MYTTTTELGYKLNRGIKNICIEISTGNKILVDRQVVKICVMCYVCIMLKQHYYSPRHALRLPGGLGSQITKQSAHECGKVVSLKLFTLWKYL
jgi:hypothetical protein